MNLFNLKAVLGIDDKEEASENYPMPSAFSVYKKYMDKKLE